MRPRASSLTVRAVPVWRLRHWWSPEDYRILPLPPEYPTPLPVSSRAVYPEFDTLSASIYPGIYSTGYGRFRPNKSDHHLCCGYYRGGWHPSYPALSCQAMNAWRQSTHCADTWGSRIVISHIVQFSRLLRPVGPGLVSQNPSLGDVSQHPYPSKAREDVTLPST